MPADYADIVARELVRELLRAASVRVVPIATPAAGAEWSILVPGGAVWWVQSIHARFNASAVVATRIAAITCSDGTNVFARVTEAGTQAASSQTRFNWLITEGSNVSGNSLAGVDLPWPDIPLQAGVTLQSVTTNLDAGDQWSELVVYVMELSPSRLAQLAKNLGADIDSALTYLGG